MVMVRTSHNKKLKKIPSQANSSIVMSVFQQLFKNVIAVYCALQSPGT